MPRTRRRCQRRGLISSMCAPPVFPNLLQFPRACSHAGAPARPVQQRARQPNHLAQRTLGLQVVRNVAVGRQCWTQSALPPGAAVEHPLLRQRGDVALTALSDAMSCVHIPARGIVHGTTRFTFIGEELWNCMDTWNVCPQDRGPLGGLARAVIW